MTKAQKQEMLDVLTRMSIVAKQILAEDKNTAKSSSEEAQKLLDKLKASCAAE